MCGEELCNYVVFGIFGAGSDEVQDEGLDDKEMKVEHRKYLRTRG